MRVFNAFSSIFSPSWKSMARLVFPSRLELKRPEGSFRAAPFGKVLFQEFLEGRAGADHSVVVPPRTPSPLPLLDDLGFGFFDWGTEPADLLPPPVAELLDSRVYQLRRRRAFLRPALLHA